MFWRNAVSLLSSAVITILIWIFASRISNSECWIFFICLLSVGLSLICTFIYAVHLFLLLNFSKGVCSAYQCRGVLSGVFMLISVMTKLIPTWWALWLFRIRFCHPWKKVKSYPSNCPHPWLTVLSLVCAIGIKFVKSGWVMRHPKILVTHIMLPDIKESFTRMILYTMPLTDNWSQALLL